MSAIAQILSTYNISQGGSIPTANMIGNWDAQLGVTSSGGAVSQWNDQSGGGHHLIQATGANQPTISGSGTSSIITFDGSNDNLKTAAWTFSQPYTYYIVMKQITWTSLDYIISGAAADDRGVVVQFGSTPQFTLYDGGGTLSTNGDLTLGSVKVVAAVFNNTSSSTSVNDGTKVTFAAGGGVGGTSYFKLGAANSGGFANIAVQEIIVYSVAHNAATQTSIVSALRTKWGI